MQEYADISDATGYTYQQDGHSFYVLNFPTADTTWVYDVATGAWHERASFANGEFNRHRASSQMFFNSTTVVGDYQNGKIYEFDLNVYADDGQPQKWLRSWRALPTGANNLARTIQHSMQLDCETGVGLNGLVTPETIYLQTEDGDFLITESGDYLISDDLAPATQGANPQAMLRWSDDGGHTWSSEHWKSMGKIGRFGYRTIWRRLGATMKIRDRVYEVSGTDPVRIYIMGAELLLSGTSA
jgi:hypothetical protein